MKKILLFFSLAVLLLPLAAGAAVTGVTSPELDESWNQGTTRIISWTSDTAGAKFNISLCPPAGGCLSVKTNIDKLTYDWPVGKLRSGGTVAAGDGYVIKVCQAGLSEDAGCDSSLLFNIWPPHLTSQQQVFDLFKKAMGNRYNDLNANRNSGVAGVWDFIMTNWGTDAAPDYKISVATVNDEGEGGAYRKSGKGLLLWFKDQFIARSGSFLNARDKAGITNAMVNRHKDWCLIERNNRVNTLIKNYNNAITAAETVKNREIKVCADAYNSAMRNLTGNSANKFIAKEEALYAKNTCINLFYQNSAHNYYGRINAAINMFRNNNNYRDGREMSPTGVEHDYKACRDAAEAGWNWRP